MGWPYSTSRWQKLRRAKLSAEPLCEICERRDRIEAAQDVDHITPVRQGGAPFPALDGLMSLCHRCHSEKTAMHDKTGGNAFGRRFKGADQSGNPIDPGHGRWGGGGGG
ncbi:HNH endonuclease [Mangrovicoccus sp. HB161399]|uniref:HNH endonuclease n=1 Tax=Mangrovicoccus sp. HB161399 TaxID=2720392 RepID=UPI0020A6CB04|nr:HNH endonuclease signature motif containing protein [Mangrovicoccus sp. HB161399]